ncbi:hypothetical protein [Bradyrhizobium prioriisuperbiae]|uniref:hypothetical protein n=1 Tax=Bradyrhizobium prioriisuperbiae TaxID=2854389 RepID=UPI0028E810DB|nr:hypothetical protein [Bradyrhizobium prioritasuperba]
MTVCIAARSQGFIILTSDRMLTSGDIQFEPVLEKTTALTNSISIMLSGDSAFHTEVLTDIYKIIEARINSYPSDWWEIKDVVNLYVEARIEAKRRRAETAILRPLGLTSESFVERQAGMDQQIVETITRDLIRFDVPSVHAIIAGVDVDILGIHPHIFTIQNDEFRCDDAIGFASIGSGARHAETSFMNSRHAWNSPLPETLLLSYFAKKNAEVAPGVGRATDMWLIGPGLGQSVKLGDHVIGKLDVEYRNAKARERKAQEKANREIKKYVENLAQEPTPAQSGPAELEAGKTSITEQGEPQLDQ